MIDVFIYIYMEAFLWQKILQAMSKDKQIWQQKICNADDRQRLKAVICTELSIDKINNPIEK